MTQRKVNFQAMKKNKNHPAGEGIGDSWASLSKAEKRIVKYRKTDEELFQAAVIEYRSLAQGFGHELEQICLRLFLELDQLNQLGSEADIPLSHQRYMNAINNITQRLVRDIVTKESVELATLCVERLVATAINCFNHKNYQAAFIIMSALDDASVSRLSSTMQGLSTHCVKKLNQMKSLLNPGIHRNKRGILLKNREGAIVPPIEYFKYRYHQTDLNIDNLKFQLAEALEPNDAVMAKKISDKLNVLNSSLAEAVEAGDPVSAEKINRQISSLTVKLSEATKPDDPVRAKNISEQIADFVLHKEKLTATITVMQSDLQAAGANTDTEDGFFMLDDVTRPPVFTVNTHDEQTYAASNKLEARDNRPLPSTLLRDYPDLLLATNTRLHLDKRVRERLKLEKIADKITHLNMKIADLLTSLRAKPILGLNRKHTVNQVKVHLQELETYVKTRAVQGCIDDIEGKIEMIEDIIAGNPFVYSYLPNRVSQAMNAVFGLSAGHVEILEKIKKLLIKEGKLQVEQNKLERRFEYYHDQKHINEQKHKHKHKKKLKQTHDSKPDDQLASSIETTLQEIDQSTSTCVVSQVDQPEVTAKVNDPLAASASLNVESSPECVYEQPFHTSDNMDPSQVQSAELPLIGLFSYPAQAVRHTDNMPRSKSFLSLLTLFESMEKMTVCDNNESAQHPENTHSTIMRKRSV